MGDTGLDSGTFADGIPYARFGDGAKTMLFLAGGPGNLVPTGIGASGFVRGMRAFTDEYTIFLVTRKSGLPVGYSTRTCPTTTPNWFATSSADTWISCWVSRTAAWSPSTSRRITANSSTAS